MLRRVKVSFTGFAACFFALAMLSNCYCQPSFIAESPAQVEIASHCEHHSEPNQSSKRGCSPRYNTDDVLRVADKVQITQQEILHAFDASHHYTIEKKYEGHFLDFSPKIFLGSTPSIYIQVCSFLI